MEKELEKIKIDYAWMSNAEKIFESSIQLGRVIIKNSNNYNIKITLFLSGESENIPFGINIPSGGEVYSSEDGKMLFGRTPNGDITLLLCVKQGEVVVPNGVKYIGQYAFRISHASIVKLPDSVIKIDDFAFRYCHTLEEINFPQNLREIGCSAFSGCKLIQNVNLNNSLLKIGEYAFKDCDNISHVDLGNSVQYIGHEAFGYSYKLKNISFPASIIKMDEYAFPSIDNIYLEKYFSDFEDYLDGCLIPFSDEMPFLVIENNEKKLIIPKGCEMDEWDFVLSQLKNIERLNPGVHTFYKLSNDIGIKYKTALEGYRLSGDADIGVYLRDNLYSYMELYYRADENDLLNILKVFKEHRLYSFEMFKQISELASQNGWIEVSVFLLEMSKEMDDKKDIFEL